MSYRNDTNATYDRAFLSSVPDPTRAERQVRSSIFPSPPFFKIGNLSPSSPFPPPFSHFRRPSLTYPPRLIGGLQYRLVRRRPRSPRAHSPGSRSTTYGPATAYRGLQPWRSGPHPQGRAAGEWCQARRRERAVVSHEMGGYSDRHRHHPYHWCNCWRRSRRHTPQLQQK